MISGTEPVKRQSVFSGSGMQEPTEGSKNMSNKRLYKSSVNCMLCGVCGGIAEYFDIDPTLVRLAWVILTCFGGAGIWAYIIAAIIIPRG